MHWFRIKSTGGDLINSRDDLRAALESGGVVVVPATRRRAQAADVTLTNWRQIPSGRTWPVLVGRNMVFVCNKADQKLIVHVARGVDQIRAWAVERNRG